jgi:hypothetical protein
VERAEATRSWNRVAPFPNPTKPRKELAAACIPFQDERGRRIDVHSLRHTSGTELSDADARRAS